MVVTHQVVVYIYTSCAIRHWQGIGFLYVCGCCGYEYVGDLNGEPDDYVCPICGQPKKVFRPKA